jgi:CzcA family heavy metal efflux pump
MKALWLKSHRLSLLFLLALFTLGGILGALQLPVTLFPDIQFPRIVVNIDAGDRPVDRMVIEVTQPLEQALRAVPDVTSIRSTSNRGSANISINFNWNNNMVIALLQVQSAINQILPSLPAGTNFTAKRMDPTVFPILGLALTAKNMTLIQLRDFASSQLQPMLSTIPGIAHVETLGGQQEEYQVLVDPEKLRERNLTIDDVAKALTVNNVVTAIGRIEDYYRLYIVLADTRLHGLNDIQHTILHSGGDGIIELSDVATIISAPAPQWTKVTANGHDAVLLNVMQQPAANTVSIVNAVTQKLVAFKQQIPSDINISFYYDQSELVKASALSVKDAILIGAILAAVILLLFLKSLRMTVIVALILPCVLATTILLLYLLNMSFNIMTLGGMAAAVGLIIDDGVVMLEHIMRRLSEKSESKSENTSVLTAAMEMLRPLTGSSLATIIIFLPLAFLQGVTGGFFKALALTIAASLIISFFFVLLVVPILGEIFLTQSDAKKLEKVGPYLAAMHNEYNKFMNHFLENAKWLLISIVSVIIIGYLAFTQVGSGFMPHMDEGGFILDYVAPPGTSLTETDRLLRQVEKFIIAIPELASYSRRTGLQLGGGLTESNTGDFFIRLKNNRSRNIDTVMTDLRNQLESQVPGLTVETAQLMEDMIGDLTTIPQPIEIKVFGTDLTTIQSTAKTIAGLLGSIKGVVEIFDGLTISGDAINIKVDRVKSSLLGLDPDIIGRQLQSQLTGSVISSVQSSNKLIGIRVATPQTLHERIQQLQNLPLRNNVGHLIQLHRVATINIEHGQSQLTRENLKPMQAVTARIERRDLGSTMNDVKNAISKSKIPVGVYIEYGGLYQEQQKSFYDLSLVFISAVLLITVLLLFLYESFYITAAILMTTLLSFSGTFIGLWITKTELNISAMMGITMVVGIVTEIAIFYFCELNTYDKHGKEEMIQAGIMRMRPIIMTSSIAILALMPLALGLGTGSAMQQPLAIAIISGLIFAVPLILLVMPALYFYAINSRFFRGLPKRSISHNKTR